MRRYVNSEWNGFERAEKPYLEEAKPAHRRDLVGVEVQVSCMTVCQYLIHVINTLQDERTLQLQNAGGLKRILLRGTKR